MIAPLAYELSAQQVLFWALLACVGMVGSAVYSGLETGVYRLNRVRLHLQAHHQRPSARLLSRMIRSPNRTLGTLLIGNNIANYAASFGITALLEGGGLGDWQIVFVVAAILTPLLFVFGEVLPKDLFQNYTDVLTYRCAALLNWTQRLVLACGLLPLIDGVSWLITRAFGSRTRARLTLHPRRIVSELVREGLGYGLLSPYQSDMIDRVLHPTATKLADAMVRWDQVQTLRANQPVEAVWAVANRSPYSRFPVLDAAGEVRGALNVFDVLMPEPDRCPPIDTLVRPLPRLPATTSLRQGLLRLRQARSAMALVVDNHDRPVGIVTVKDLVEPITGELDIW